MDRKDIVKYPILFFAGGIIVSVAGLTIMDVTRVSATLAEPPTRVNVAQRAPLLTRTTIPTLAATDTPLPTATSESTETPVSGSEVVPTPVFTPTATLAQNFTSPTHTLTPTTDLATRRSGTA